MASGKKMGGEVTPLLTAGWSKNLYEKDTKFAKTPEDAKYVGKFLLPKDGLADLQAGVNGGKDLVPAAEWVESLFQRHEDFGGKRDSAPIKDGDLITDKEGKPIAAYEGMWVITARTKKAPNLVDTQKNKLGDVQIFGGDLVKASLGPAEYEGFGGGMTLYLNAVMLIEKRGGDGLAAFGNEEGYVAEQVKSDDFGDDAKGEGKSSDY